MTDGKDKTVGGGSKMDCNGRGDVTGIGVVGVGGGVGVGVGASSHLRW